VAELLTLDDLPSSFSRIEVGELDIMLAGANAKAARVAPAWSTERTR
jgi:hypothetical protein